MGIESRFRYSIQSGEALRLAKLLSGSDLSSIQKDGFFLAGQ